MMEQSRKGWCPSLATPMATGDGLLVRLYPRHGLLSPRQLAGLADAAGSHGNGRIEITTRGNLQLRGFSATSLRSFEDALDALGIDPQPTPEIRIPPLACLDAETGAALASMADRLRAALEAEGLAERLSAKFAVLLESPLSSDFCTTIADIRLILLNIGNSTEQWDVALAGDSETARSLGAGGRDRALATAMSLARAVADLGKSARGRDISPSAIEALSLDRHATASRIGEALTPASVGRQSLPDGSVAIRIGLAFGQIEAAALSAFCLALPPTAALNLLPHKMLMVGGLDKSGLAKVEAAAARSGMVTRGDDLRLSIQACAGAPACASGKLATHSLAKIIVTEAPEMVAGRLLYLAGCAKQCARPEGPHIAITGGSDSVSIDGGPIGRSDRARLAALAAGLLWSGER